MLARHTKRLESAVKEAADGTKYLNTVSVVRRSRSVPAMQRHALEAALASHLVRAKVELDRWNKGVTEINALRRGRNPDKLKATLASWQFAEDDPVVVSAREDLARWRYIEEQMPGVLKEAFEDKDIETIRSSLKQLSMSGPSNVQGSREARGMLKRYDSQVKAMKEGVAMRNVEVIQTAIDNFDFPEDEHVEEARATIDRQESQLRDLQMVVASERVNGRKLVEAVTAWEFDSHDSDFTHAVEVLQGFRMEAEALEEILRQDPVNLLQLRIAMDSWSFATDPDSSTALDSALTLLNNYEEQTRAAVSSSDGHGLRELLASGSDGQALGNEELLAEANELQAKHAKASTSLLELVRTAPNLEATAKDEIAEKCQKWAFDQSDPVFELGRAWLRLQAFAAECSGKELEEVARAGFGGPTQASLGRQQALPAGSSAESAAKSVVAGTGKAWQAAGALAFGVAQSRLPEGTLEGMMQSLKGMEAARNQCSPDVIREVRSLAHPPDAVHCFLQVVQALLTGSSTFKLSKEGTSWKVCQEMLIDARKFFEHLGEVPAFISTGRRSGVIAARALDAQMRAGPAASEWSVDGMGEMSSLCQSLFGYMECIFRYDDLVSENFASSPAEGEASFKAAWQTFQASIKELGGLPDSQQLAALFLTSGGSAAELQRCESRSAGLLESARSRTLKLKGNLDNAAPLQHRLEVLRSTIHALDASELGGHEARHLAKAASYFVHEGQPSKRIDGSLRIFCDFLREAIVFVHDALKGQRPHNSRITVCERRIQARMFEWAEMPMYQFTVVSYYLKSFVTASQGEAKIVFSEFIAVLRTFYDEFLPLYMAWATSTLAVDEAEAVHRTAGDVAGLPEQLLARENAAVFSLEPAAVLEQLDSLGGMGIVVAAPHVQALSEAAALDVARLLESPDMARPALKPSHVEKILAAHLSPVARVGEVLGRLAKRLATPGAMPSEVAYLGPVYQLMVAVCRIFAAPGDPDVDFTEARRLLTQPKALMKQLSAWQPLRDASVEQLKSSQSLLLRLWSVFRAGSLHPQPSHDERHRTLFAWASLATSLIPLLSSTLTLAPAYAQVKAAAASMKRQAEESSAAAAEKTTWHQVQQSLHRADEPWWWLRLIGCKDPKGFYVQHGLALDTSSVLPEVSAQPVFSVVEAPVSEPAKPAAAAHIAAGYTAEEAPAAAPASTPQASDFERGASRGSDEFEQDDDEGEGYDEFETTTKQPERGGYSGNFDESEGDGKAKPGSSPNKGEYSQDDFQDDFENDNDKSPKQAEQPAAADGSAEFEADFEQDASMADNKPATADSQGFADQTFEADDSADLARVQTGYSEGFENDEAAVARQESGEFEFEGEESPKAAAAAGPEKVVEDDDEFEADDDFEADD